MSIQNIPFGKYGYSAEVQELADILRDKRQRKRDIENRIRLHGETPERLASVERLTGEIAELKARYDRAAAEDC